VKKVFFIFVLLIYGLLIVSHQSSAERMSHKEYAKLDLKDCNECHKAQGIPLTHDNDWAGKHHQNTDWLGDHRVSAGKGGTNCSDCHAQSFCSECHFGGGVDVELRKLSYKRNYMPKNHRTDFISIHPIKAKDNPQTCTRCHTQKFCSDCHSKFSGSDLKFKSHRRQFSDLPQNVAGSSHNGYSSKDCQMCHPNGLLTKHEWSADHAIEARRNLQSCQVCHSDGKTCLTCHSSKSGLRVSPHPRNWASISGNFKSRSNGKTCAICHN